MGDPFRMVSTLIVWATFAAIMILADVSGNFITVAILALAAVGGTAMIWDGAGKSAHTGSAETAQKSKRDARARIARLVQDLDDDEVAQLGQLLSERDERARS